MDVGILMLILVVYLAMHCFIHVACEWHVQNTF